MDVSSETTLRTVLVTYPSGRELLSFYGLEVTEALLDTTIGDIAEDLELDADDLIEEFRASDDD